MLVSHQAINSVIPQKIVAKGGKNLSVSDNVTPSFVVVAGTPELLAAGVPIHLRDFLATGAAGQAPVVSETWLLDSIRHNSIISEEKYRVPGVSTTCTSNDGHKSTGKNDTHISSTSTTISSSSVSSEASNAKSNHHKNNKNTSNNTNFYLFRCDSVSSRGNRSTITLRRLFWSSPINPAEKMAHVRSESIQMVFLRSCADLLIQE